MASSISGPVQDELQEASVGTAEVDADPPAFSAVALRWPEFNVDAMAL